MRRRGFTLLELLVVIGVISVLAAILLPVIEGARREALSTSCRNNLGNLSKAVLMYSINRKDFLPTVADSSGKQLFGRLGGSDQPVDFSAGYLSEFIDDEEGVWQCPSFPFGDYVPRALGPCTGYGYNYQYLTELVEEGNWWDPDYKYTWKGLNASIIRKATTTVLFGDSATDWTGPLQENWFWTPPSQGLPWGCSYTHFRHGNKANIAWADGHVDSMGPDPVVPLNKDLLGEICDTNDRYFDPEQ
jgi:prepilin-type N-terminal cleavage/methylation domain-containing protein/prepilin-type processing-associated H-X9-DG protein